VTPEQGAVREQLLTHNLIHRMLGRFLHILQMKDLPIFAVTASEIFEHYKLTRLVMVRHRCQ
jgi:hypothetical protein